MREYYTKAELEQAQSQDIIGYLKSIGYELKQEGHFYRGVLHDSMVINSRNGHWHWNSKDVHGNLPVELLKQILIYDYGYEEKSAYISAVKKLAGTEGQNLKPDYEFAGRNGRQSAAAGNESKGDIILPTKYQNCNRVIAYLCKARGLDYEIVKELLLQKKLYETKQIWNKEKQRFEDSNYHNAVFVSYGKDGVPHHAFMRGTLTDPKKAFKSDVENADKSYGFILQGRPGVTKVFCFESAIDELSHATLYKMNGMNCKNAHRISLHGTSFLALEQFLKDNPQIKEIISCLDNDETGIKRSKKLCQEYAGQGYRTFVQPPEQKDYNEQLLKFIQDKHELDFADEIEID